MGEHQGNLFEPQFNRAIKVQGTDQRITSNAGVILLREAEHRLGLFNLIADDVLDPRHPDRIRYTIAELIRERVFAMAVGYSAQDDVDRLAHDPAFRAAVWDRNGDQVIDQRLPSWIHCDTLVIAPETLVRGHFRRALLRRFAFS